MTANEACDPVPVDPVDDEPVPDWRSHLAHARRALAEALEPTPTPHQGDDQ